MESIFREEYATFTSPDGNYRIVVVRMLSGLIFMPGQAGDAPGKVLLYQSDGKLLQETRVEMVQLVNQVHWMENRVQIKLIADWELPH